jgi:hypothetical protein
VGTTTSKVSLDALDVPVDDVSTGSPSSDFGVHLCHSRDSEVCSLKSKCWPSALVSLRAGFLCEPSARQKLTFRRLPR